VITCGTNYHGSGIDRADSPRWKKDSRRLGQSVREAHVARLNWIRCIMGGFVSNALDWLFGVADAESRTLITSAARRGDRLLAAQLALEDAGALLCAYASEWRRDERGAVRAYGHAAFCDVYHNMEGLRAILSSQHIKGRQKAREENKQ